MLFFHRLAKVAISKGIEVPIDDGMEIEKQCYSQLLDTEDRLEGLAAFAAKRVPVYRGLWQPWVFPSTFFSFFFLCTCFFIRLIVKFFYDYYYYCIIIVTMSRFINEACRFLSVFGKRGHHIHISDNMSVGIFPALV